MAKKSSTSIDLEFQKFWDAYGLKRDRVAAERAWRKLSKSDRRAALAGIQRYRDDCEALGIQRMYAQGYLNHRRWEDEAAEPQEKVSSSKFNNGAQTNMKPETCQPETRDSYLPDMAIW